MIFYIWFTYCWFINSELTALWFTSEAYVKHVLFFMPPKVHHIVLACWNTEQYLDILLRDHFNKNHHQQQKKNSQKYENMGLNDPKIRHLFKEYESWMKKAEHCTVKTSAGKVHVKRINILTAMCLYEWLHKYWFEGYRWSLMTGKFKTQSP